MRRPVGRGRLREVLVGSKPDVLGDKRAFRFWEIVSSTALREMRRKSDRLGC